MSERELKIIEKKITPLVAEAEKLVVKDEDGKRDATELLSRLNKVNDSMTEDKEKVTKPLLQALNAERSRWKPYELMYKNAIEYLRDQLSRYQTAKVKAGKEEEQRIAERALKGNIKLDTAARKIGEIDRPTIRVETEEGMVTFRTDRLLKITDRSLIPDKFWVVDEEAVLNALKAGIAVPGAEIEEVQKPINRR